MFKTRPATENDVNFVYQTWLRCYKYESPCTKHIERAMFFTEHHKLLDNILAKDTTQVLIACDENDEELIFGYLVHEPHMIHFVYVKEPFRKMGIATKLLEGIDQEQISHLTYSLLDLWNAGKTKILFNPYKLMETTHG